jgi:hypothetical protein
VGTHGPAHHFLQKQCSKTLRASIRVSRASADPDSLQGAGLAVEPAVGVAARDEIRLLLSWTEHVVAIEVVPFDWREAARLPFVRYDLLRAARGRDVPTAATPRSLCALRCAGAELRVGVSARVRVRRRLAALALGETRNFSAADELRADWPFDLPTTRFAIRARSAPRSQLRAVVTAQARCAAAARVRQRSRTTRVEGLRRTACFSGSVAWSCFSGDSAHFRCARHARVRADARACRWCGASAHARTSASASACGSRGSAGCGFGLAACCRVFAKMPGGRAPARKCDATDQDPSKCPHDR